MRAQRLGDPIIFDGTPQTIRLQQREDGVSLDQIVLSPVTFASVAPGAGKNDSTILAESAGTTSQSPAVVWTALANVSTMSNGIQKSGGCGDCFNAGGASQQPVTSGQTASFTVSSGQRLVVGLNRNAAADPGCVMDYAFSFWPGGTWEIREGGLYKADGSSGCVFDRHSGDDRHVLPQRRCRLRQQDGDRRVGLARREPQHGWRLGPERDDQVRPEIRVDPGGTSGTKRLVSHYLRGNPVNRGNGRA